MEGRITLVHLHQLWLNEGVFIEQNDEVWYNINYFLCYIVHTISKLMPMPIQSPFVSFKIPAQPRPIGGPAHGPWDGPAHDKHCLQPFKKVFKIPSKRTRWELSIAASATSLRTLVCELAGGGGLLWFTSLPSAARSDGDPSAARFKFRYHTGFGLCFS